MLILTRRPGDAIRIDGDIRIVILASDNSGVRIGIEAPASVGIFREEIVDRIVEENRRAGATIDARKWLERLESADGASETVDGDGLDAEPETGSNGEDEPHAVT